MPLPGDLHDVAALKVCRGDLLAAQAVDLLRQGHGEGKLGVRIHKEDAVLAVGDGDGAVDRAGLLGRFSQLGLGADHGAEGVEQLLVLRRVLRRALRHELHLRHAVVLRGIGARHHAVAVDVHDVAGGEVRQGERFAVQAEDLRRERGEEGHFRVLGDQQRLSVREGENHGAQGGVLVLRRRLRAGEGERLGIGGRIRLAGLLVRGSGGRTADQGKDQQRAEQEQNIFSHLGVNLLVRNPSWSEREIRLQP